MDKQTSARQPTSENTVPVAQAPHTHTAHAHSAHTQTREVINRLSRVIGHLEAVKTMVETGRDCSDVLIQLAAVRGAVSSISRIVLKDHMQHCIVEAIEQNDQAVVEQLNRAIDQLLK